MKESIIKLPKSAIALYVKLYCQKQHKTKKRQYTLIEATKSWITLSKADKHYFINEFNKYKEKTKKHLASNLRNAQLYMKKKHNNIKRLNTYTHCNKSIKEETGINEENRHLMCNDKNNEIEVQQTEQIKYCDTLNPIEDETQEHEPDAPKLVSEPIPPMRSSMELFEIIKHQDESTQNVTWAKLSKLQKQRYQRAVLKIKHDYLKQYRAYLEQLTPEQLFQYYRSKF